MDLYSDFPVVSHSIADFNQRTKAAHNTCQSAFMQVTLSGEYEEEGETLQVLVDTNRNLVEEDEVLQVDRDIDSCLGISDHILIDAPISVWTIPPGYLALKASIHLTREIIHEGTRYDVPYHHIPNFELGTFGQRCQLNVFFPRLWTPDHSKFEQPWFIKEEKRAFWYEHGIRPAIAALLGDHIASQWPPTFQTEQLRAAKSTSANPGWSTKMIPREAVGHFADAIRTKFDLDVFIDDEDRYWASQFFFLHTIRGVKDTTRHNVNQLAADLALDRFVNFSHLVTNHHLRGEWYVDVAIEISSPRHQCLQWSTQSHCSVVAEALRISNGHASRVTQLSSSKYSRDIVSHLSAVSGFRITPGPQAEGEFEAVYIQAYTTDKTLTSNNEKGHHAKFIEAKDALGQLHPPTVVSALYDIYEKAKEKNYSNARLEIRVPWARARTVLTQFDHMVFQNALYSFTREEWWDFRLMRLIAISKIFSLQSLGPAHKRFSPDSLLLTAGCIWLLNSLHARPDDGPASRDLMSAALPLIEVAEALDENLAYSVSIREENYRRVPHIPFGCIFFRRMVCGEVPRLRMYGPLLPAKSFQYFFKMDIDAVEAQYTSTGLVDKNIVNQIRFPTAKRKPPKFFGPTEKIFDLARDDHELAVPVIDDGSDVEPEARPDSPPSSGEEDHGIDTELSRLWCQFVSDVTMKSPTPRNTGGRRPSYMKLTPTERSSGSEAPYNNLRLDQVFTDVYYKIATEEEKATSFNHLFPPRGYVSTTAKQNYRHCPYYQKWMKILEQNNDNAALIDRIRSDFRERLFGWKWMPKAESDKMWTTSFKKDSKGSFIRWPPSEKNDPAPFILVSDGECPLFEPQENEARDAQGGAD